MWEIESFARERHLDLQREVEREHRLHDVVHRSGNGAGSRGGWRNGRQRLGHSLVRAGAAIAGDSHQAVR